VVLEMHLGLRFVVLCIIDLSKAVAAKKFETSAPMAADSVVTETPQQTSSASTHSKAPAAPQKLLSSHSDANAGRIDSAGSRLPQEHALGRSIQVD